MIQPGGVLVVLGEEGTLNPVVVTPLDEAQGEHFLAVDFGNALDFHLARVAGHARATGGTGDTGDLLHGITVDLPGLGQRDFKVTTGTGVPFHKHVVGDDAQLDLGLPKAGPVIGIVVDVCQQRALGADHGAGGADPAYRFPGDVGFQFLPVVVVSHQRQVFAAGLHFPEQIQKILGIVVGYHTLRPEGQRLGTDADGADLFQFQQRLDMGAQVLGLHDQRIATGDQHIGDFRVCLDVLLELTGFLGGDFQIVVTNELGPAEAEGAVAVTHLPLAGEEQHSLVVLVLDAVDFFAVHFRHVVFHLPGGVRVQGVTDFGDGGFDFRLVTAAHGLGHLVEMLRGQHAFLRKGKLVDGIIGHLVPVDQFVDDVLVDPERQHIGNDFHGKAGLVVKAFEWLDLVELARGEYLETARLFKLRFRALMQRNDGIGFGHGIAPHHAPA